MPVANFRHPQLLQPESFSRSSFVKSSVKTAEPVKKVKKSERRRVQFKDTVSVRPIRHVNNISEEEIKDVWYCRRDFQYMKAAFALTVKMITLGLYEGDCEEHCARGLEYRTLAGALRRRESKWDALNAVLDEQDRQRELGIIDGEIIRRVFLQENTHCRLASLETGIQDQDEARFLDMEDIESDDASISADEMDYVTTPVESRSMLRAPARNVTNSLSRYE
jgi:hypothetical protein